MKIHNISVLLILCMIAMVPTAPAQVAALPVAAQPSSIQVGVVAAVTGRVELSTPGEVGRIVESGEKVYMGDIVKTDGISRIQLMLMDETVFTIGPNSSMTIDEYVYDPASDAGKISARVLEGTFRFITGRIPQKKPSNMEVKLPVGVMAVRGTIVYLHVEGEKSTGILAGPGDKHNTGHRIGRFIMKSDVGGHLKETLVTVPGRASEIAGAGQAPTGSFEFPKAEYEKLKSTFVKPLDAPKPPQMKIVNQPQIQQQPVPKSRLEQKAAVFSGEKDAEGFKTLKDTNFIKDVTRDAGHVIDSESEILNKFDINSRVFKPKDGLARNADLFRVQTGKHRFLGSGITIGDGTYNIGMEIDFGARKVATGGASNSFISGNIPAIQGPKESFSLPLLPKNFGALTSDAIYNFSGTDFSCGPVSCVVSAEVKFNNSGGIVAQNMDNRVVVYDGITTFIATSNQQKND